MKHCVLLIAVSLGVTILTGAQQADAQPSVSGIAIDSTTPSILYLGTYNQGIFKTVDSGDNWRSSGLTDDAFWGPSIVVDKSDENTIYAGNGSTVFKSTDGGQTWTDTVGAPRWPGAVWTLFQDSASPQTLYAGTYIGVFKTTNAASSWERVALPAFVEFLVTGVTKSSVGIQGWTYVCSPEQGIFKSNDEINWSTDMDGIENFVPLAILTDQRRNILYAGLCGGFDAGGVYTKSVGEAVWSRTSLRDACIVSLALDPNNSEIVFAGAGNIRLYPAGGIFKSTNGGGDWIPAGLSGRSVDDIAIDPVDGNIIYAATNTGLFKTVDGGANWERVF